MAESPSNSSKNLSPALTLILPLALLLLFLQKILPLLIAIATVSGGWHLLRRYRQKSYKHQGNLDDIFYRFIQEHQGRVTVLDLAMHSKFPPQQVQQYLDQRAAEFSAQYEVTEQGGMIYYFETVQSLFSPPTANPSQTISSPETQQKQVALFPVADESSVETNSSCPRELNQSELAQRLDVHPSTIRNWKHKSEFQQWSEKKDPDAIAWYYSTETKRFYPIRGR
ncbi:MAG: hypothetical protein WBA77_21475 [Microcoleaceae cyanobacterium]